MTMTGHNRLFALYKWCKFIRGANISNACYEELTPFPDRYSPFVLPELTTTKILVADDDCGTRSRLKAGFEHEGWQVLEASDSKAEPQQGQAGGLGHPSAGTAKQTRGRPGASFLVNTH